MNIDPIQGQPPSDEQKQMVALMQELRKDQIGFLDEAGKRFVELTTGLLGVLFAVTAFGDKFPPPYLAALPAARVLAVLTLLFFLSAMAMGMRAAQPRTYTYYESNLTGMREEFDKIIANKARSLRLAGWLFWIGAIFLAALLVMVIFGG